MDNATIWQKYSLLRGKGYSDKSIWGAFEKKYPEVPLKKIKSVVLNRTTALKGASRRAEKQLTEPIKPSVDYLTGQQGVENNCGPVLSLLTPFNIFP